MEMKVHEGFGALSEEEAEEVEGGAVVSGGFVVGLLLGIAVNGASKSLFGKGLDDIAAEAVNATSKALADGVGNLIKGLTGR